MHARKNMFGKKPVLVIEHHGACTCTADFHIGQDQNDGVKETKPLGIISNTLNLVPGHQ